MVRIVEAGAVDKPIFEKMLDPYLSELKTHWEISVGATDSTNYPYLDLYWNEEGRHPYLVYFKAELVGFSFVRGTQSTKSMSVQIAEFYIRQKKGEAILGKRLLS